MQTLILLFHSDVFAPIHDLHIVQLRNTLNVQWDHDYYLCRNFTIYLNGTVVHGCTNITALNCTIGNLGAGMMYEVRVVATESDTEPIEATTLITTTLDQVMAPNAGM